MNIIKQIGEPATLEQLAEECAELSHAALKLARLKRKENYTPRTKKECLKNLEEELADVKVVSAVLQKHYNFECSEIAKMKYKRWKQRIKAHHKHHKHRK